LDIFKTVKGSDGKKIGVVGGVVEDQSASLGSPVSFYFTVDCGGFLGIRASHLYIPVEAVASAHVGQPVVLLCTAQEAGEKYTHQPEGNDSSAQQGS